jgi:hypothetical protein
MMRMKLGSPMPDIALSYGALHNAIKLDEHIDAQVKLQPSYESKTQRRTITRGSSGEPALEAFTWQ